MIGLPVWLLGTKAKLIAGGILFAGLWWYHQHALAVVYSEAAQEATEAVLKDQAEAWKVKQAEFDAQMALEREDLEGQRMVLAAERAALSGQRRAISTELQAGISKLTVRETDLRNEISTVTDADVVARYRDALLRARAADAARAQP